MVSPVITNLGKYTVYDYGDHVEVEPPNDYIKLELESYGKYRGYVIFDYYCEEEEEDIEED